jgi:hypothetical protein
MGSYQMAELIYTQAGVRGFYDGLSACLLRQSIYSGTRFGMYDILKQFLGETKETPLSFSLKLGSALLSGGIAAAVANPTDVAMVRMQADGNLPVHARRNYRHVFDALIHIVRHEGVRNLWRGVDATVNRAMLVNVGHTAAYDQSKEFLMRTAPMWFGDDVKTHFSASMCSAFAASVLSNPLDVVKTRLMQMKDNKYSGSIDCLVKTVQAEGPLALYKGFVPTFARQAPFVVVTWLTMEQLKRLTVGL